MSSPDIKYPDPPDPVGAGESVMEYYFGDSDWAQGLGIASPEVQEAILKAERTYGPQYVEAALERQRAAIPGLIDLAREAMPAYQQLESEALSARRAAEIGDVEALGARATRALRESDPERLRLLQQQQAMTDDLFARAAGVTPQQARMAEQGAREAYGARGRELDNASIFAEALNREGLLRQNRMEAQQSGANLFGMLQATGSDPFQAVLGRSSGAMPYAANAAQQAMGLGQTAGPTVFSPDAGVNLGLANQAQQGAYNQALMGAQAAQQGAWTGGLLGAGGQILGSAFGLGGIFNKP